MLVLDEGLLSGIITPKDLLNRVVAKGLDPDNTAVSDVMTSNPDTVPPAMTVLDALREVKLFPCTLYGIVFWPMARVTTIFSSSLVTFFFLRAYETTHICFSIMSLFSSYRIIVW